MLNNKQKNFLRKEAINISAFLQIGKDGLSENTLGAIENGLIANELVKISLLKTCPTPKDEIALNIAVATKCDVVQVIGRVIVLYRTSKNKIYTFPR